MDQHSRWYERGLIEMGIIPLSGLETTVEVSSNNGAKRSLGNFAFRTNGMYVSLNYLF